MSIFNSLQTMAADKDSTHFIVFPTDAFVGGISVGYHNDSLFEAGDYAAIIDNYYKADHTSVYELIGALYALGSPIESYKQLLAEVYYYNSSLYGNAAAAFRNANNDAEAWLYYMSFPKNKRLVDSLILDVYRQENVTAPQYGKRLFRYLIDDQYPRMLWGHAHSSFSHLKTAVRTTAKDSAEYFRKLQDNSDSVFQLYQKAGHIFSKEEVGSIYDYQFLLLTHENDTARRAYYLKLIKTAVNQKTCPSFRIISFLIRSTYLNEQKDLPHFFKNLDGLVDSLKIQYHQPDYVLSVY